MKSDLMGAFQSERIDTVDTPINLLIAENGEQSCSELEDQTLIRPLSSSNAATSSAQQNTSQSTSSVQCALRFVVFEG